MKKQILTVPIEISARHIHLSQHDLEILFDEGYVLTPIKNLSQKGQFAAKEVVEVQTDKTWGLPPHFDFTFGASCDHNQIRVLGPVREYTQVELSWTDCFMLNIKPHVAVSGDYGSSSGEIIIVGQKGEVRLQKGIIVPQRHIHCSTKKAAKLGLTQGQYVSVKTLGDKHKNSQPRSLTFHNVIIRIHPDFDWHMHLDTDEGNAAGLDGMGVGEVIIS